MPNRVVVDHAHCEICCYFLPLQTITNITCVFWDFTLNGMLILGDLDNIIFTCMMLYMYSVYVCIYILLIQGCCETSL